MKYSINFKNIVSNAKNYKTLMKNKIIFKYRNTPCSQIEIAKLLGCQFFPYDIQIQYSLKQNPSKLFCRYQQTAFKVYMGRQKSQDRQSNTKEEQQN